MIKKYISVSYWQRELVFSIKQKQGSPAMDIEVLESRQDRDFWHRVMSCTCCTTKRHLYIDYLHEVQCMFKKLTE